MAETELSILLREAIATAKRDGWPVVTVELSFEQATKFVLSLESEGEHLHIDPSGENPMYP